MKNTEKLKEIKAEITNKPTAERRKGDLQEALREAGITAKAIMEELVTEGMNRKTVEALIMGKEVTPGDGKEEYKDYVKTARTLQNEYGLDVNTLKTVRGA